MQLRAMPAVLILAGMMVVSGASAQTQSSGSAAQAQTAQAQQTAARAPAQIDLGVSAYVALKGSSTSGNGTLQTPHSFGGGMIEVRYIAKPLIGFEFAYGYNPGDQTLAPNPGACHYVCQNAKVTLPAKASTVSLDWVFSRKMGSFRPFAVTGLGFYIDSTDPYEYSNVNTVVRPAFVLGGGVDWGFLPKAGLRLQYRDMFYKAPNLDTDYPATGQFTSTSEPMAGFYYRF